MLFYTTTMKNTECCNGDCNQGRTCPVRLGTHKPAEAVHQIEEPASWDSPLSAFQEGQWWVKELDKITNRHKGTPIKVTADMQRAVSVLHHMLRAARNQDAHVAQLEAELAAIGAGGVEPLRKQAAPAAVAVPDALIADARRLAYVADQIRALEPEGSESDVYLKEAAHVFRACADRITELEAIGAGGVESLQKMRAAFESSELSNGRVVCLNLVGGRYTDKGQQDRWEDW